LLSDQNQNNSILSRRSKVANDGDDVTDIGSELHVCSAAIESAQSPIVGWAVCGTARAVVDADRTWWCDFISPLTEGALSGTTAHWHHARHATRSSTCNQCRSHSYDVMWSYHRAPWRDIQYRLDIRAYTTCFDGGVRSFDHRQRRRRTSRLSPATAAWLFGRRRWAAAMTIMYNKPIFQWLYL